MRKIIRWMIVTVVIIYGSIAVAEESQVDRLVDACFDDIQKYCSQVTVGDGRLLYCMAAHEDKVSGECHYAIYQTAAMLEQLAVAMNYLAQECGTDIKALCSDVAPGEGRLLACLEEKDKKVSDSCKKAIDDTIVMESNETK